MFRLLLVRHGETAWNVDGRYQGQADVPLNAAGRRQAARVAERLADASLRAIYASDLKRAWETAELVACHHDAPLQADVRLREFDLGAWQGRTYQQIAERDPERLAAWNADRVTQSPPGGETLAQLAARVAALLEELHTTHSEGTIALISHGGTLRVLLCVVLGYPLKRYWQFEVDNTAIAEIEWRELGPVVVRWNDVNHLDGSQRMSVF